MQRVELHKDNRTGAPYLHAMTENQVSLYAYKVCPQAKSRMKSLVKRMKLETEDYNGYNQKALNARNLKSMITKFRSYPLYATSILNEYSDAELEAMILERAAQDKGYWEIYNELKDIHWKYATEQEKKRAGVEAIEYIEPMLQKISLKEVKA